MIGQSIGHYRITAKLGQGGMGEVYRATDAKLGRDVAIKLLPADVSLDAERVGRFRREAHLLASLNHPNIAAIYGFEKSAAQPFLVLELVEGEDLKQRLEKGAVPVEEALEIAEQIAEALEEAHNKGIVHRDLKPANVKLCSDGKVKVLDFGLAKAWSGETADGNSASQALSHSPTLAQTGTVAGVILGTAAYMSPEQARGKPVDKRADIWSFGVLLWEMLTGKALFGGETITDVLAAVVTKKIDLDALPASTPPSVRRLLDLCLRQDPRMRLPDIGAVRLELQDVLSGTSTGSEEEPPADVQGAVRAERRRRRRERWIWALASVVLAGFALTTVVVNRNEGHVTRSAAHFLVDTPPGLSLFFYDPIAVSPDGQQIAFVAVGEGVRQLWIRRLDSPQTRVIPGTEDILGGLIWSPDSASLAFAARGELRKLDLAIGSVQRVCALPENDFIHGTWSPEGMIVFSDGGGNAHLYSIPATGGEARLLLAHDESRGEVAHYWPQFLPGGDQLLLTISSSSTDSAGLHVLSLDNPDERRMVRPESAHFQYVPSGHLLFTIGGILMAQRFDVRERVIVGEAVTMDSSVASSSDVESGWFSASDTGRLVWVSGQNRSLQLEWIDRAGRSVGLLGEPRPYGQIALSPDNKRVAAEILGGSGWDLWMIDVARGVPSRFTIGSENERDPVWSPDSRQLVFSSDASGDQDLLVKNLQGSEPAVPLAGGIGQKPRVRDLAESWSADGNTLIYLNLAQEREFWAVSLDNGGQPEPLLKGQFGADEPQVSPDGRWLAYISQESGRYEVYIEPFRRLGERVRVSLDGGGQPKWSGNGKELFYLALEGKLLKVDVGEGASGPEVGIPVVLIEARELRAVMQGPDYDDYAVTSDGQRFLVKRSVDENDSQRINVVIDWLELLE